jgi:dolichyl-phosphate beta-glucosyltransferase
MALPTQSLVIPAYNEAQRLAGGLERLRPTLEVMGPERTEIVMVDDGSTDATLRVAHQVYGHLEHFRLVQHPHNLGKGAAVRTGLAHARFPKVIVADADMSIRPEHFVDILDTLERVPVAPGSRDHNGKIQYATLARTISGTAFHVLVRHYTKTKVRDTQCGCKGFQLAAGRLMALLGFVTGFAYDVEMFYLARQLDFAVEPVAVTWDDIGGSKVSILKAKSALLGDLRNIPRARYQCPVVVLDAHASLDDVRRGATAARVAGLVIARGDANALVVMPRDGAVAAVGIAESLGASVRTADLAELRGRRLEAV